MERFSGPDIETTLPTMASIDASSRRTRDDSFPNDEQLERDHENGVVGILGQPGAYSTAMRERQALQHGHLPSHRQSRRPRRPHRAGNGHSTDAPPDQPTTGSYARLSRDRSPIPQHDQHGCPNLTAYHTSVVRRAHHVPDVAIPTAPPGPLKRSELAGRLAPGVVRSMEAEYNSMVNDFRFENVRGQYMMHGTIHDDAELGQAHYHTRGRIKDKGQFAGEDVSHSLSNTLGKLDLGRQSQSFESMFQQAHTPRAFYKRGRMFMTYWSEPKRNCREAFTKLTRFVVVKPKPGYSVCLRVSTYTGKGTTKYDANAKDHAAIIPVGGTFTPHLQGEYMIKSPIEVKIENEAVTIDPMSRINFAKPYTVEHNLLILNVGRVVGMSVGLLDQYFAESMGYAKVPVDSRDVDGTREDKCRAQPAPEQPVEDTSSFGS